MKLGKSEQTSVFMQPGSAYPMLPAGNVSVESANMMTGPNAAVDTTPLAAPAANCTKSVYQLLQSRPDASAFLRLANETGMQLL